jgi:SAM-dependent methyltransferase
MKPDLIEHLICPECGTGFDMRVSEREKGEIKTGVLRCTSGHSFPITKFIPRFVDADRYADSFSRQRLYVRRHFKYYLNDRSGDELFQSTTSFTPDELKVGLSLEVGCGYGRFLDVVQRSGGRIIGIDLSTHSIELAHDFVGLRPNVYLVQCDLFKLPFRRDYFDRIFSIGVLHHTPSTRQAFEALVPHVAHGGRIAVWVYNPDDKKSSDRWRKMTTRMSHRVLYGWCIVNQLLFSWIRSLPGGWRFSYVVPGNQPGPGRPFWLRVLSDFDDLSPRYAHVHGHDEVVGWFSAAGLSQIRALNRKTAVVGMRG